jgi:DNA-directed RNA polymerase subunit RPC12/RpoP
MQKVSMDKKCKECGSEELEAFGYCPTGRRQIRCSKCGSRRLEDKEKCSK